jgi:hypothetical protein
MARPTYVNIPDTDVDLDSPGKTNLVFKRMRDNINALRIQLIPLDITEKTTGSGTFVSLVSFWVFIPNVADYTGIARRIVADFEVKVDSGANTGTYRLKDSVSSDVSNEVTTTSTTYEFKNPVLTIDPAWLSGDGVSRLILLEGKVSAGTAYARSLAGASWFLEY